MYPLSRLITSGLKASFGKKLAFGEISEIEFITRPWDLDMFLEMNNGRVLTLYDLGRFDLAIRSGFTKALRQNGWGLAVAGSTIRYRRRITLFEKVSLRTVPIGYEGRWFYLGQSMWVGDKPASNALLRTCVTEKGKAIGVSRVASALGNPDWNPELPEWVKAWDNADNQRVWPPVP
jgi:acyl-CoA thioesterase FadM